MRWSSNDGISLQEVLIAAVILAILSPVIFQTYRHSIATQQRRALQEQALNLSSDYLEYSKFLLLAEPDMPDPFDTVRVFRGDTLLLRRRVDTYEYDGLSLETFAVSSGSDTLVRFRQLVTDERRNSLW